MWLMVDLCVSHVFIGYWGQRGGRTGVQVCLGSFSDLLHLSHIVSLSLSLPFPSATQANQLQKQTGHHLVWDSVGSRRHWQLYFPKSRVAAAYWTGLEYPHRVGTSSVGQGMSNKAQEPTIASSLTNVSVALAQPFTSSFWQAFLIFISLLYAFLPTRNTLGAGTFFYDHTYPLIVHESNDSIHLSQPIRILSCCF